jgi:hypothetical protein
MEGDAELRAKQEKIIGKLNWLVSRTKTDFKGNPAPVAKSKTKQSVERVKKEADKFLQGGTFAPYGHVPVPLAMDATKPKSCEIQIKTEELPADHHIRNKYHQVLDSRTGRPAIYEALHPLEAETQIIPLRGKRRFGESSSSNELVCFRPSARDVDLATPREKLQLLRADALEHPMFTDSSRFIHACDHWDPSSQLGTNPKLTPPQKKRAPLVQRRNEVRMVSILRRTAVGTSWK